MRLALLALLLTAAAQAQPAQWVPAQAAHKTLLREIPPSPFGGGGSSASLTGAGNGTAAAPAFSFASDPDTGMYRVGANELGFSTGGTLGWSQDSAQMLKCNKTAGQGCLIVKGGFWVTDDGVRAFGYDNVASMQYVNLGISSTLGFTSSAASGTNGFACATNGCRFDFGDGADDYLKSDGTTISTPGVLEASAGIIVTLGGGTIQSRSPAGNGQQNFTNPYYGTALDGSPADDASAIGVRLGSATTLTTAGSNITTFHNGATATKAARVDFHGFYLTPVQTLTVADDGAGTAATATLTPTSQYVNCTCNDANSCAITMGETGVQDGTTVEIVSSTATACTFADTAGVTELSGALTLGQYDTLRLIYLSDRWVQLATTNN